MSAALDDPRITTQHISLYAALLNLLHERKGENPLYVFRKDLMPVSKISGRATFYRTIKELHEYGYIDYTPSYNHFLGNMIRLHI